MINFIEKTRSCNLNTSDVTVGFTSPTKKGHKAKLNVTLSDLCVRNMCAQNHINSGDIYIQFGFEGTRMYIKLSNNIHGYKLSQKGQNTRYATRCSIDKTLLDMDFTGNYSLCYDGKHGMQYIDKTCKSID